MNIDPRDIDQRMKASLAEKGVHDVAITARRHRDDIVWEIHQMLRTLIECERRRDAASININFRVS